MGLFDLKGIASALRRGVERLLASRILGGLRGAALGAFTRRRTPELPEPERRNLIDFSQEIRQAGERMRFIGPDDVFPTEQVPVNPYLWGDEPAGRRFRYDVNVYHPDTEQQIRVSVISGTELSLQELAADAFFTAGEIFAYEKFGSLSAGFGDLQLLDIVSAQRSF